MCAIIDADKFHQAFGNKTRPAGVKFREWIRSGPGVLVTGGDNLIELRRMKENFKQFDNFARRMRAFGKIRTVGGDEIEAKQRVLLENKKRGSGMHCTSGDEHIIALAQVSGARLLYSGDGRLQNDFRNKELIDQPQGEVYTTDRDGEFTEEHEDLLNKRNLCNP